MFILLSFSQVFACSSEEEILLETLQNCHQKQGNLAKSICVSATITRLNDYRYCEDQYEEILSQLMQKLEHNEKVSYTK